MTTTNNRFIAAQYDRAGESVMLCDEAALPAVCEYCMGAGGVEDDDGNWHSPCHCQTAIAQPAPPANALVDDLTALVSRLARALNKAAPSNDLPMKAMDYLARKDLIGSPLRSAEFGPTGKEMIAAFEQPVQPAVTQKRPIYCGTGHCSCIECLFDTPIDAS